MKINNFSNNNQETKKSSNISHINFKELNQNLDAKEVLAYIGYDKSKPINSFEGIRDYCPIHGGDNQRSLAINTKNNTFFCHSCNAKGDLIQLYALAENINNFDSAKNLKQYFNL